MQVIASEDSWVIARELGVCKSLQVKRAGGMQVIASEESWGYASHCK